MPSISIIILRINYSDYQIISCTDLPFSESLRAGMLSCSRGFLVCDFSKPECSSYQTLCPSFLTLTPAWIGLSHLYLFSPTRQPCRRWVGALSAPHGGGRWQPLLLPPLPPPESAISVSFLSVGLPSTLQLDSPVIFKPICHLPAESRRKPPPCLIFPSPHSALLSFPKPWVLLLSLGLFIACLA